MGKEKVKWYLSHLVSSKKKILKENFGTFGMLSYMKTDHAGMELIAWSLDFIYIFVWAPHALIWSPPNLERPRFLLGSTLITPASL